MASWSWMACAPWRRTCGSGHQGFGGAIRPGGSGFVGGTLIPGRFLVSVVISQGSSLGRLSSIKIGIPSIREDRVRDRPPVW